MKYHFYYSRRDEMSLRYWLIYYYSFNGEGFKHRIFRLFGASLLLSTEYPVA